MQEYIYKKEKIGDLIVKVINDENPINPREDYNLGTMVYLHRRYNLGDINKISLKEAEKLEKDKENICFPVYMYEHSGIALSLGNDTYPFNDQWDSGKLGFIYITKEKIREEYKVKNITKKTIEKIKSYFKGEIETYNKYLNGEVYGYQIENEEGEVLESSWGFYDDNDCLEQGIYEANSLMEEKKNEEKEIKDFENKHVHL